MIPTHDLESKQGSIQWKTIAHRNHYDFTQQHRHSYFEVMFFVQGGGTNLIDFVKYEVKSNACYLIYPGQIHLLQRSPGSHGVLIQFDATAVDSARLQRLLQEKAWSGFGAVVFEENDAAMQAVMPIVDLMGKHSEKPSVYAQESQQHLLQALLLDLFSLIDGQQAKAAMDPDFYQFLQLVDQHFREVQKVASYLDRLPMNEKRLSALAQKYLGTTPLQIIHQRILLEAKRLLVTGNQAHKEIAYDLGFDSPASFSAFIKKKTGLTASEIQAQVTEIHKQSAEIHNAFDQK